MIHFQQVQGTRLSYLVCRYQKKFKGNTYKKLYRVKRFKNTILEYIFFGNFAKKLFHFFVYCRKCATLKVKFTLFGFCYHYIPLFFRYRYWLVFYPFRCTFQDKIQPALDHIDSREQKSMCLDIPRCRISTRRDECDYY